MLMFRKFTNFYIVLLVGLIIIGSITIFISGAPSEEQQQKAEELTIQKTPGYKTMVTVTQIANSHNSEHAILDIQVTPKGDHEKVLLQLQASEFSTEDILLENTYNLLQDIHEIETIDMFTISWFMLIKNENTEVLTMTFNHEALKQVTTVSYNELPNIMTDYKKHELLN